MTTPERFLTLEREWRDLVGRAIEPNAFMEPAVVAAAARAGDAPVYVFLAWRAGSLRLEGAWALALGRPSSGLPLRVLKTPIHDHAFLGTPVLDRDAAAGALAAMFDRIGDDPDLPDLVEIGSLSASEPVLAAFHQVLAERPLSLAVVERRRRPELRLDRNLQLAPPELASSRVKALRRRRRKLNELGRVTSTAHGAGEELDAALQDLLTLEAAGWKGQRGKRGRAMLREPALAAFVRSAVRDLAARGLASIRALRIDGMPVAMQLTIRSGATAFTWKSTYDEHLRQFAPGLLLLQDVTASLLSDHGVSAADSCNRRDDGYMAEFWTGRRPIIDVVLDIRPGASTRFRLLRFAEQSRRRLRAGARAAWHAVRAARAPRHGGAA